MTAKDGRRAQRRWVPGKKKKPKMSPKGKKELSGKDGEPGGPPISKRELRAEKNKGKGTRLRKKGASLHGGKKGKLRDPEKGSV